MSIESVMPSNHLILCCPRLLLPSIFPSIRVFSYELTLASDGHSIGVSASVLPMNVLPLNFLTIWFFFVVVAVVAILGTVERDVGLIPGTGRSPGEGNGNLLQYSCLGNPMDRGAWRTIAHGVEKNWVWLNDWACMQKIRNQDSHDPCFSVLWWLHDGQEFFDSEILNLGCLWLLWAVVMPCRCSGSWSGYNRVSQTVNPNNRHVLPGD